MILSEDNFPKITNGDMGNFVHFGGILAIVSTFQQILSFRFQSICSIGLPLPTFHIKLVPFENIDI